MKRILLIGLAFVAMSAPSLAAPTVRLCTGGSSANYFAAGKIIAQMAGSSIKVQIVETEGTIDNMERTLNKDVADTDACDAMIGQPDGPVYLSRTSPASVKTLRQVGSLHREYLHVLCNKESGVDDLGDLESNPKNWRIAIGEQGSGAWLIWQNLVAEDSDYGEIPVSNEGGILALSSVSSGETTCMLVPAGLGNGTVKEADATLGDTVQLVGANDKDFDDALDIKGKPLYEYSTIPGSAYPNSFNYWNDVKTISWLAGVYVNTERFQDKKALTAFVQAVTRSQAGIKAEFGK